MDLLVWAGDIELSNGRSATGVQLVATRALEPILHHASLHFLACVDIARIPLYLAIAHPLDVYANNDATEDWFSALLLSGHAAAAKNTDLPWWQHASTTQSPIGILVEVRGAATSNANTPPLTELLFYATTTSSSSSAAAPPDEAPGGPPSPTSSPSPPSSPTTLVLRALPLSSDLLQNHTSSSSATTPPTSPSTRHTSGKPPAPHDHAAAAADVAEFHPPLWHPGPTANDRKRQSVSSLFDEAAERRKRARRHGGESVAAAAAGAGSALPPQQQQQRQRQQHKRSASFSLAAAGDSRPGSADGRPLSRSPSLSVMGGGGGDSGGGIGGTVGMAKRTSSLSRVVCASVADAEGAGGGAGGGGGGGQGVEARNKDVVSRLVMAGMRMYGLQQRKRTAAVVRKGSVASDYAAPAQGEGADGGGGGDAARDEEYKLVYHQAYRGTVFAMRNYIATESLTSYMEQLRETVDKLLAIFCTDPLATSVEQAPSSVMATPVPQQQPFGTPTGGFERSPFGQRTESFEVTKREAGAGRVHTPVTRKQAG